MTEMASSDIKSIQDAQKAKKRKRMLKQIWQLKWIYLFMLLPGLAVIIIFRYLPLPGIALAWKKFTPTFGSKGLYSYLSSSKSVGWKHFQSLWREADFWTATRNTFIISMLKLVFGFPFPVILAILINEMTLKRYKKTVQTIYTFPHFLSWVVVSGMVLNLFGDTGAIKSVLSHINPTWTTNWNFLYNSKSFRPLLVISDIWKEGGWGTILYLAAIAGIDPSLHEAAIVDGANRFQRIIRITLPEITSLIIIMLILQIGNMMNANFDQIFNLYSPPVFDVGDVIDTYIYRKTFQSSTAMDYGFSTAVGLFKNVINFILLIGANRIAKIFGHDGIM